MDATGFRSFKVWLGFIAPVVAFLLIAIVPGPPESVRVEFRSRRMADGSWGPYVAVPVEDVSKMHPMMPVSALCLAAGWAWWFFWLYRRHQQLAELTDSTYPVRPGPAAGFHFVPGYNLYWVVHWTRRFTHFCDLMESGLLQQPASPAGAGNAGKPPAVFAGNMSAAWGDVKPGWVPGIFMCLAMVVACGAFIPRNYLLRKFGVMPPPILANFLWALVIALGVATVLDRRFLSAVTAEAGSIASAKSKATLGI